MCMGISEVAEELLEIVLVSERISVLIPYPQPNQQYIRIWVPIQAQQIDIDHCFMSIDCTIIAYCETWSICVLVGVE
jgi:hypothetical protein